jgi:hypothetical protein
MGVRSAINNNSVIAVVIVIVVAGAAVWTALSISSPRSTGEGEAYFTADDGKTWFADKSTKVTPYTKDGKQVVRAHVYQCKGGKPFVAYLTKQNPNAPRDSSAATANASASVQVPSNVQMPDSMSKGGTARVDFGMTTVEFKRPGDAAWEMFGKMSDASKQKFRPLCTDGGTAETVSP